MKRMLMILCLLAVNCLADDKDCPPAVDMAEAQNHNLYKDCDYSNKGLNGVLHRALKKKSDAAEQSESSAKPVAATVKEEQVAASNLFAKGEFNSAAQLQSLRFALIQKAAADCPKGFLLESEKYLPQADKSIKLELLYRCL